MMMKNAIYSTNNTYACMYEFGIPTHESNIYNLTTLSPNSPFLHVRLLSALDIYMFLSITTIFE